MDIYKLTHVHLLKDQKNDEKDLGYFSNLEIARDKINFYRSLQGFREYPNDFYIQKFEIDGDKIGSSVFEAVFYLHDEDYSIEFDYLIGVYLTEKQAEKALEEFKSQNNNLIITNPLIKEFVSCGCLVDVCQWTEGFTTDYYQ